ncbi:MAG: arginine repressor [Christensenella sp.]|uniref:arginine repressor n=1 Tax=Christensenella sp. TaxID=1935934 RepID=UPI002B21EFEF|nr:arginine repressor [Christensenella sp.]MEA5002909.1 arginine repressor [Christensenella sp.]
MKSKRQNKILDMIDNNEIETQEELVTKLNESGFKVTQATISRDIKELQLIKVQANSGAYKYAVNKKHKTNDLDILMRIFKDTVVSIDFASNLLVIKTLSGSANAAAEVIDSLHFNGIMGTLAGDNTIFVATDSQQASEEIAGKLMKIINK